MKMARSILKRRINRLKERYHYVTGLKPPSREQQDDLRAFTLLCHAEMEEYFESVAESILARAKKKWDDGHKANYNLACLFLENKIEKHESIPTKVEFICSNYRKTISKNNGVTRRNILALFGPLGYEEKDFPEQLLLDLETFGQKRGGFAHLSFRTVQIDSQDDIYNLVDRILDSLEEFESAIKNKK